jgi:hypothetical protein
MALVPQSHWNEKLDRLGSYAGGGLRWVIRGWRTDEHCHLWAIAACSGWVLMNESAIGLFMGRSWIFFCTSLGLSCDVFLEQMLMLDSDPHGVVQMLDVW